MADVDEALIEAVIHIRLADREATAKQVHEALVQKDGFADTSLSAVKRACSKVAKKGLLQQTGTPHSASVAQPPQPTRTQLGAFSTLGLAENLLTVCGGKDAYGPLQWATEMWLGATGKLINQLKGTGAAGVKMAYQSLLNAADGADGPGTLEGHSTGELNAEGLIRWRAVRPFAQYLAGELLIDSTNALPTDRARGLRYWREAASKGLAVAVVGVGNLIRDIDPAGAMAEWKKALTMAASPEAGYNLGVCFGTGHGVQVDLRVALEYYEHAAAIDLSEPDDEGLKVPHAVLMKSGFSNERQEEYQALARRNLIVVRRDLTAADAAAAPRPPTPPDAKPKPRGVRRPKNLPDLYPGPPPWLADGGEGMMRDMCAKSGMPMMMIKVGMGAYLQQRKSDDRWRHLNYLYRGKDEAPLSAAEHKKMFTEAGWDLRISGGSARTFAEVMELTQRTGLEMLSVYKAPSTPLPRFCDYCGRQCTAECRCGESYCDKDCQAKDWASHREICETCADNAELAMSITKQSWGGKALR